MSWRFCLRFSSHCPPLPPAGENTPIVIQPHAANGGSTESIDKDPAVYQLTIPAEE